MKIAHVLAFYTPAIGGVTKVVEELTKRQIKEGHEVHVYCSDWDIQKRIKKGEEIINGVHVHRCYHYIKIANFESIWPSVFPKLMKENFDVIHTHVYGHFYFVLAAIAAKLKGIPHIHTTHCPWTDSYRSLLGRLGVLISYNTLSRLALKHTSKIIAITPWEVKFIEKFGGRKEQILVIPNGMSEEFFKIITPNNFKKEHNIKGKLVLFFGRLNITKAPDKFVEIAKMVLKERPNTTFVIRGPDEGLREKVKQMISDEKRIILLSETRDRNEIIKMYQAADIFVLPSFREGLPLTLFEAMASNLPIVASPVNGVPYEMKQPDNGFLVKFGDNEGFKQRIIELLDNPVLAKVIAQNDLNKAYNYRWDLISQRTLEVYRNAIKELSS